MMSEDCTEPELGQTARRILQNLNVFTIVQGDTPNDSSARSDPGKPRCVHSSSELRVWKHESVLSVHTQPVAEQRNRSQSSTSKCFRADAVVNGADPTTFYRDVVDLNHVARDLIGIDRHGGDAKGFSLYVPLSSIFDQRPAIICAYKHRTREECVEPWNV